MVCVEPSWSDWIWLDGKLARFNLDDRSQVEECCDLPTLESHLQSLENIKQEYLDQAKKAKKSRYNELMRGVREKDEQIKWVKNQLRVDGEISDPTPESPEVEVVAPETQLIETEELTDDEARDLLYLERKVERAFYEAGKALQELRSRRLFRSSHKTFEEYCASRFGFKRRHPYRLIDAADVVDNLIGTQLDGQGNETQMCPNGTQTEMRTIGTQNGDDEVTINGTQNETDEMCTNGTQILPTSERQVRPLTSLEPDQQREAWQKAVEKAGGKVPSGRIVKSIVDQILQRRPVSNNWHVGEVASIIVKDNPDLRGKGGCWAVITAIKTLAVLCGYGMGNI